MKQVCEKIAIGYRIVLMVVRNIDTPSEILKSVNQLKSTFRNNLIYALCTVGCIGYLVMQHAVEMCTEYPHSTMVPFKDRYCGHKMTTPSSPLLRY